jgi:septation ring formation regulator EzrA
MSDNERELNLIQTDLDRLHERSQTNKANISAHEAVCEERYAQIISTLGSLSSEMKIMHKKLNDVNDLASQGKTSLRTLLWVGGVVSGVIATLSLLFGMFPK